MYTFDLKRSFRFHTGAAVTARSFADAFNRDADPRLRSPATSFMHEIEGADAVIDGKARSISGIRVLGRYRLQIRLTRPLGDFTARLTTALLLPRPPQHADRPGWHRQPGGLRPVLRRRVGRQPADRPRAQPVLPRQPSGQRRPGRLGDRQHTEACLRAVEENRLDHCVHFGVSPTAFRELAEKYGINRPGGQFFVSPGAQYWYLAFNHDRPAFQGPGQIPLKKAINYAIDRPALLRPVGYLAGKRTDQILPPALGRAESIYPLGGPTSRCQELVRSARLKPTTLVYYSTNAPRPSSRRRCSRST